MHRVENLHRWVGMASATAKRFMKSMGLRFASRLMFPPALSVTTTRAPAMPYLGAGVRVALKVGVAMLHIEPEIIARMRSQCFHGTTGSSDQWKTTGTKLVKITLRRTLILIATYTVLSW